jgi:hypothetical protein
MVYESLGNKLLRGLYRAAAHFEFERMLELLRATRFCDRLNLHVFGAVIQMRVVESIAFDIASSFNKLFSVVKVDGVSVFTNDKLAWIRTHIKAEKFHQKQVSDEESGILCLASSAKEQKEILEMTKHYLLFWSGALSEFKNFLVNSP